MAIWYASSLSLRVVNFSSFIELWVAVLQEGDSEMIGRVQTLVYLSWKSQNQLVFQKKAFDVNRVLTRLRSCVLLLLHSRMKVWELGCRLQLGLSSLISTHFSVLTAMHRWDGGA